MSREARLTVRIFFVLLTVICVTTSITAMRWPYNRSHGSGHAAVANNCIYIVWPLDLGWTCKYRHNVGQP
jgi:hypothetical protein